MESLPTTQPFASPPLAGVAAFDQESASAKVEKLERHGPMAEFENSTSKRLKPDPGRQPDGETLGSRKLPHQGPSRIERRKGVAPIKAESVFSNLYGRR